MRRAGLDPIGEVPVAGVTDSNGRATGLIGGDGKFIQQFAGSVALPKWRAAIGKMRNGERNAKLAFLGSSSVTGYGAAGVGYAAGGRAKSFVNKLTLRLNQFYDLASNNGIFGSGNNSSQLTTFDPRVSLGSGWSLADAFGDKPLGGTVFRNTTSTTAWTFTPENQVDTFEVYYQRTTTSGTFTLSVDGGAALATIPPESSTFKSTKITVALGAHTLSMTQTVVGAGSTIHAVRAYDSTKPQIEVFQWGHTTWMATDAITKTARWSIGNVIGDYAPDLVFIAFATNSWLNGESLSTFKASTQALIDICKAAGSDVVLLAGVPTEAATTPLAVQQIYVDGYAELARANGLLFIDNWRRMGSYEQGNALGLYSDTIHCSGAGYGDYINPLVKVLTEI